MAQYYTVVGSDNMVKLSMITTDTNFELEEGERLVADTIPERSDVEYAVRIEPVPLDASSIGYIVLTDPLKVIAKERKNLMCEPLDFMERFSDEEQLAIAQATMSNAQVKLWYDKMLASKNIVFDDVRTIAGLNYLVESNILSSERRDMILSPFLST